jgi:hypothetical protein
MAKCIERRLNGKIIGYYVWCQGCKSAHFFPVSLPHPQHWAFSGTLEKPTFKPSLRHYYTHPETKQQITTCHITITDGIVEYHGDCPFDLKGQKLELQNIPEDYGLPPNT